MTRECIPLKTPFVTALRRVENVEFIRVKIFCDEVCGVGEAPATKAITGEDLQSIEDAITGVEQLLIGISIEEALALVHHQTFGSSAKAALDMALVSLLATHEGVTLAKYLGATDSEPIQTDITISLNEPQRMLSDATKAFKDGIKMLKIKLGKDISHAIEVTQLLSYELPQATLLIDANQAWSLEESLHYLDATQKLSITLLEQPVGAKELQALQTITHRSHIPILADESAFVLEDVRYIVEHKIADMINIKLMKCGGVTKAVEILEYAREQGIVCMMGSMLEGPTSIAVANAIAQAYRDVIKYVDLDSPLLYSDF